ncbi:MAG: MFS transporter [Candidatus Hodarchaeales archaeon]|jgi:DHA1 family multidrug resistance protein-like MFS transporter
MDLKISNSLEKNNLIALSLASISITVGFGVIIPFFPLYAQEILDPIKFLFFDIGIALQVGIFTSAFMLVRFLLAPAFGDMSDISGRKPIILVGMSIYAVLMVLFGFSFDFLSLLIVRGLQGLASAAVWPVGEALIVDSTSSKNVGKNLGYYILSMQVGMGLGPFLGFILFEGYKKIFLVSVIQSYRLSFFSVGIFGFIAMMIVAYMVKDPKISNGQSLFEQYKHAVDAMFNKMVKSPFYVVKTFSVTTSKNYRNRSLYSIYAAAVVNGFGNAMIFPLTALLLSDYFFMEVGEISIMLGVIGIITLVGAPIGGWMSDHSSKKLTVSTSGVIRGILGLLFGLQAGIIGILVLLALQRFLFAILQPAFRAMQNDYIPSEVRGKEFGIVQALFNLGSVFGPIIGGWLYDLFFMQTISLPGGFEFLGAGVPYTAAGVLAIFAAFLIGSQVKTHHELNFNHEKRP